MSGEDYPANWLGSNTAWLLHERPTEVLMGSRREFFRKILVVSGGMALFGDRFSHRNDGCFAAAGKTESQKRSGKEALKDMNPQAVDASELEITPLADFGTMGLDDYTTDLGSWRLRVEGDVRQPLKLTYAEVQEAPAVQRAVLLICPGVFANHGSWGGISVGHLLQKAGITDEVNFVTFRGPEGRYEKVMRVPIEDALSDKVFLAYRVNGTPLPQKHGFPLRLVAEGYFGYDWVKYVYSVTADIIRL